MIMIPKCNTESGDKYLRKWLLNLVGVWHVYLKLEDGKLHREGMWGHYTRTNSFNYTPEFMDRIVNMHHDRPVYICNNSDFFPTTWMDNWEEMK
jgi:hypothetical protein